MVESAYDSIAEVYATDMGASMPFDDVGYYRDLCLREGGRVLELGCGTGRILLSLLEAGIDIEGLDRSEGMLGQLHTDAGARGLEARTHRRDILDMPRDTQFDVILAPYSLVTYLAGPDELATWLTMAHGTLSPSGLLVVDAFIPRDVTYFDDFRQDYVRPHGEGFLRREKRIAREGQCNRIQRRYSRLDGDMHELSSWITVELIRPWTPQEIADALTDTGFHSEGIDFDYGEGTEPHQFATHRARRT
ncbi:MAG: hypothetical protein QOG75_6858 [Mycobacterium sp.]|nr:hypothetical protein [Mycobacterium sp.]